MIQNPLVIICDDEGNPTGEYMPKEDAHTGSGKHHLAITVLLYNKKGQILLQSRKHLRFDGKWDITGATDLYHQSDGSDETYEESTSRCLKREYDIENVDLRNLGQFNYFAPDGKYCENEHCALMIGEYNGKFKLNPEVGYGFKWMNKMDFLQDINDNADKYSPWAHGSIPLLKKDGFFS